MLEPSGVAYINGYGSERALVSKEATGITTKIVQSILGFTTFKDSTFVVNFPHCILVAFGGENYGEYARSLKRFSFIAIQHLRWLWTFLGISNSGITVFSSDFLETVVTTTKSQNI